MCRCTGRGARGQAWACRQAVAYAPGALPAAVALRHATQPGARRHGRAWWNANARPARSCSPPSSLAGHTRVRPWLRTPERARNCVNPWPRIGVSLDEGLLTLRPGSAVTWVTDRHFRVGTRAGTVDDAVPRDRDIPGCDRGLRREDVLGRFRAVRAVVAAAGPGAARVAGPVRYRVRFMDVAWTNSGRSR